jgi:hypothetical protein
MRRGLTRNQNRIGRTVTCCMRPAPDKQFAPDFCALGSNTSFCERSEANLFSPQMSWLKTGLHGTQTEIAGSAKRNIIGILKGISPHFGRLPKRDFRRSPTAALDRIVRKLLLSLFAVCVNQFILPLVHLVGRLHRVLSWIVSRSGFCFHFSVQLSSLTA